LCHDCISTLNAILYLCPVLHLAGNICQFNEGSARYKEKLILNGNYISWIMQQKKTEWICWTKNYFVYVCVSLLPTNWKLKPFIFDDILTRTWNWEFFSKRLRRKSKGHSNDAWHSGGGYRTGQRGWILNVSWGGA